MTRQDLDLYIPFLVVTIKKRVNFKNISYDSSSGALDLPFTKGNINSVIRLNIDNYSIAKR